MRADRSHAAGSELRKQCQFNVRRRMNSRCSLVNRRDAGTATSAARLVGIAWPLVGVELVHVPNVTEGPPQVFDGLHVVERRSHRLRRRVHGIHRCVTRSLGGASSLFAGNARRLSSLSQALPLLTNELERLTMLIADLPRLLG